MTIFNSKQRFSIRKFKVGVASVLLGLVVFCAGPAVQADEVVSDDMPVVLDNHLSMIEDEVDSMGTIVSITEEQLASEDRQEVVATETEMIEPVLELPDNEVTEMSAEKIDIVTEELISDKTDSIFERINEETKISEEITVSVVEPKMQFSTREAKLELTEATETTASKSEELPTTGLGGAYIDDYVPINPYSRSSSHLIGDDYPWKFHNPNVWEADSWGAYKRQCTSFVAYRLSSVNKFEIPWAYGNAGDWGNRARREGYRVDMTPAKGAVAWFGPGAFNSNAEFGHVAWVANVYGDKVEIEEYNVNNTKAYHTRLINRNEVSGYIHFKDLSSTPTTPQRPTTPNMPTNPVKNIPSRGRYTFTSRVGVKSAPKISSPDLAYYNAGSYVNYDSKLEADGYQWISYINYNGGRSYIPVAKLSAATAPAVPTTPSQPSIPSRGTYIFTKRTSVQAEPKRTSPELAYYNAGGRVNYDRVLVADGHQWISYIAASGNRRYARID